MQEAQKPALQFGACASLMLRSLASTSAIAVEVKVFLRRETSPEENAGKVPLTHGTEQHEDRALGAQSPSSGFRAEESCVCRQVPKS